MAASDNFFDVGSVLRDGVDDCVAEGFALIVPGALGEFVRRVLNEAGHHVLARRRDAWIGEAGDDHINVRPARKIPVFRIVVGAFHVFDAGRNGNRAAQMCTGPGQTLEIGERVERKIHFAGRAAVFVTTDTIEKIRRQLAGFEKFLEGEMRVDTRRDDVGGYFFPALQSHAASAPVFN